MGVTANGEIVFNHQYVGKTIAFDPSTGASRVVSGAQAAGGGGGAVADDETSAQLVPLPRATGGANVDMQRFSRPDSRATFSYLNTDGTNAGVVSCVVDGVEILTDYTPQVATDICGLNMGPDGKVYGCTIISMNLFSFDPDEPTSLTDLGKVGWSGGEVYDVIAAGDKVYLGSYGGGIFAEYDPSQPWRPMPETDGTADEANPRSFGPLGEDMNRPFEYVVGPDGVVYIACRSNYVSEATVGLGCDCCHADGRRLLANRAFRAEGWRRLTRRPRRRSSTGCAFRSRRLEPPDDLRPWSDLLTQRS